MSTSLPVVLLIDDDATFLHVAKALLKKRGLGFEIRTVEKKAETDVLPLIAETDVAGVLADLRMPGQDGIEILTRARKIDPTLSLGLVS